MLVLVFILKQIVVKLPFIQVNWRKHAPRGSMIVLGNKALPSLIHKRLIMTDITSWLTHLTLITTDIITELIILFPLQVGCVCSQERRGEDAFSIFYPRCSAEISWQMAEDRLTGMCMWRRSHVKNDCFFYIQRIVWYFVGSLSYDWGRSENLQNLTKIIIFTSTESLSSVILEMLLSWLIEYICMCIWRSTPRSCFADNNILLETATLLNCCSVRVASCWGLTSAHLSTLTSHW